MAQVLAAVRALPLEERAEVWRELSVEMFDVAAKPMVDWGDSPLMSHTVTVDDELEQLEAQRRALEDLTVTAARVARSADATMYALARAHARTVTHHDMLEVSQWQDDPRHFVPGEFAADDLAKRLGVRVGTAEAWADSAESLRSSLPHLFALAGHGDVRMSACETVLREVEHLGPDDLARVEEMLVRGNVVLGGSAAIKRRVRRLLASLGLSRPSDADESDRLIELTFHEHPDEPTLTQLTVVMSADQAWLVQAAIDARAHDLVAERDALHGENHGYRMQRARVDAFVDLLLGSVRFDPVVNLTVPVRLAAQRGNESAPAPVRRAGKCGGENAVAPVRTSGGCGNEGALASVRPAGKGDGESAAAVSGATSSGSLSVADVDVAGIGVVSGQFIESLATTVGASFAVALADENSGVTAWSSVSAYRPSRAIRRHVERRDVHCRFPGCMRPARFCDADHVVPHADGGATAPANLQLLCRHHHRAKTFGGWAVAMTPDGTCVWNSPTGRWYRTFPGESMPHELAADDGYALSA